MRGKGLCQLMAENKPNEEGGETSESFPQVLFVSTTNEWYSNIAYFLMYGKFPHHLSYKEKRNIKLKAANFVLWDNCLYKRNIDGTFLRCVDKERQEKFHNIACGGNFSTLFTSHKILRARYYWTTLFQDAYKWVHKCDLCQ